MKRATQWARNLRIALCVCLCVCVCVPQRQPPFLCAWARILIWLCPRAGHHGRLGPWRRAAQNSSVFPQERENGREQEGRREREREGERKRERERQRERERE